MSSLSTLIRYRAVQHKVRKVIEELNDHDYRSQFHQELSPLGWHLGHCLYIENYWLREVLDKNNKLTKKQASLYLPENCPKPERGKKLPKREELIATAIEHQDNNALLLLEMVPPFSEQQLFDEEYIQYFIIQHYAQHYESMQMILQQRALQRDDGNYQVKTPLQAQANMVAIQAIGGGDYQIGSESRLSFDNEQPRHSIHLKPYSIAERPTCNAEYLAFMLDGGYQNEALWSAEAWQWLQSQQINCPEHWRQDTEKNWYAIHINGAEDLTADHAVYGISYYEACAFAKWANARLPHEHEWEVALTEHQLPNTSFVWEWCDNQFYAYPGFKAFPYDGYSTPWFKQPHYVLRGASHHTRAELKRPSMRNFFGPDKRHIFAGCRLAYNGG